MKRFKDQKVNTKLGILFTIIMVFILAFAYMCITSIVTMTERHEAVYDEYGAGACYLGEVTHNFQVMSIKAEFAMVTEDETAKLAAIEAYNSSKKDMLDYIEKFKQVIKDKEINKQIAVIEPQLTSFVLTLDGIMEELKAGKVNESPSVQAQLDVINAEIETLLTLIYERGDVEDANVSSRSKKTITICTVLAVVMVLFNAFVCKYLLI